MDNLVKDVVYALRDLRRAAGFAVLAILTPREARGFHRRLESGVTTMPFRNRPRARVGGAVALAAAVASFVLAGQVGFAGQKGGQDDPLASEIARWSAFMRQHPGGNENWQQVRQATEPVLAQAEQALRDGLRLLALQRLAAARQNLAATDYVERLPPGQRGASAFESQWKRLGSALGSDLADAAAPASFEDVRPAALRAVAEAAWRQVRVYYEASLDYGRNTMPDSGLYYMGVAQAQHELVALCRRMASATKAAPPPLRAIGQELDALESDVLAAYRPPASIDQHPEFIRISATLKEARELDAAGLRAGALLRYLQAALRFAPLRPRPASADPSAVQSALRQFHARFDDASTDHSIARLFLEQAEADETTRAAVAVDVLPRYAAAVAPARAVPAPHAPLVTVTLVRWPYT